MFNELLTTLRKEAAPKLMAQFGLDQDQANMSVGAAADSVKEVLGDGKSFGIQDALNLFSSNANGSGAQAMLGKVGSLLQGKLTDQVGLDASKASGVGAMLLPMITDLITKQVGGDSSKLQGLVSGLADGGDMANMAKSMLGKLFK